MTSLDKMKALLAIHKRGNDVRITTERGEVLSCELLSPAEDEDDWAFSVRTLATPPQYYILPCDFIKGIEEIPKESKGVA